MTTSDHLTRSDLAHLSEIARDPKRRQVQREPRPEPDWMYRARTALHDDGPGWYAAVSASVALFVVLVVGELS